MARVRNDSSLDPRSAPLRAAALEAGGGPPATVPPEMLRAAFRTLVSGVVVVTCWVDDRPWGMTISSCTSLSADPSRLLVSLQRQTRTYAAIVAGGRFGIDILGADQKAVAEAAATAGRPKFLDEFCFPRGGEGSPAIRSAIWHLECEVHRTFDVGDHTLVVGNVLAGTHAGSGDQPTPEPLLYFNREYRLIGRQL